MEESGPARPTRPRPDRPSAPEPESPPSAEAEAEIEAGPTETDSGGSGELPTLEESEKQLISRALKRFDGNRRKTAEALGISERTLYRKLKDIDEDL